MNELDMCVTGAKVMHSVHGIGKIVGFKYGAKGITVRVVVRFKSMKKSCEYAYPEAVGKYFHIIEAPNHGRSVDARDPQNKSKSLAGDIEENELWNRKDKSVRPVGIGRASWNSDFK